MTDIVEVPGGTVTVPGGGGGTVDTPSTSTVTSSDGTSVQVTPEADIVTSGGGTTVVATGPAQIQVVEAGPSGGGGGIVDDSPYLKVDGSRHVHTVPLTSEEGFVVPGTSVSGWTFSVSPRVWSGVDYYTPGSIVIIFALQLASGDWVDAMSTFVSEDHPATELAAAWTDGYADLQLHLIDGTAIGLTKVTVISNRDWATVDAGWMALLGINGLFTLDHTETAWTWDGSEFTPVSTLAVCAPSGLTDFPDPATVEAIAAAAFSATPDGNVVAGLAVTVPNAAIGTVNANTVTVPAGGQLVMSSDATFRPPTSAAVTEPILEQGNLKVWTDPGADETWLIVGTSAGNRKIQLA